MAEDRYLRQRDLIPAARLANLTTTIIGVGAIGRNLALQLASIGTPALQLIDFDTVDLTNLASQGYAEQDLGLPKVNATAAAIQRMNNQIRVDVIEDRYRPSQQIGEVVFCCVDSISTRAAIWRSLQDRCLFWGDGRMQGEVLRIIIASDAYSRQDYPGTLFAQSIAQTGSCTSRSTIYAASIAAGLLVHQFSRWLRELPITPDTTINLLADEWVVATDDSTAAAHFKEEHATPP